MGLVDVLATQIRVEPEAKLIFIAYSTQLKKIKWANPLFFQWWLIFSGCNEDPLFASLKE